MKLAEYYTAIRLDLDDVSQAPTDQRFTEDELHRGLIRAMLDLNRWLPRERILEQTIEGATITETIDSGTSPITLTLANRFIRKGSVVVSEAGTTYVLDTDYELDYYNGIITVPAGSSIPIDTLITVTYQLARIGIDITQVSDLITVMKVEYPVGEVPQGEVAFAIWDDFLYVTTSDGTSSQRELANNAHVAVYYLAMHTPPTMAEDGSIPNYLAEVMTKGAGAYLLLTRAVELEFEATGDVVLARDQLALITAAQAAIDAALAEANTQLDQATTNLADIISSLNEYDFNPLTTDLDLSLAGIDISLGTVDLASLDLTGLPTSVATLVAAAVAAISTISEPSLSTIASILSAVDSDLASITTLESTSTSDLTAIDGDIGRARLALDQVDGHLSNAETAASNGVTTPSIATENFALAIGKITSGEAFYNTVNIGLDPASAYLRSAEIIAGMVIQSSGERGAWAQIAQAYVQAANSRTAEAAGELDAAARRIAAAAVIPSLEQQRLGLAQVRLDKANITTRYNDNLINKARTMIEQVGYLTQFRANLANANVSAIVQNLRDRLAQDELRVTDRRVSMEQNQVEVQDRRIDAEHLDTLVRYEDVKVRNNESIIRNQEVNVQVQAAKVQAALGYVQLALGFVQLAQQYINRVQMFVQAAQGYYQAADITVQLADRFRTEGTIRLTEFREILGDRNQVHQQRSLVNVRQPR
jgi:hypothetical protein